MADVHNREQRSHNMSRIRSSGNASTELRFIELLRSSGITGWRRKSLLPGKPDVVFREKKLAVFLDGCFWHSCPYCKMIPTSNCEYWTWKFARNAARDKSINKELRTSGWTVLRIWEHSLKNPSRVLIRMARFL